MKIIFVGGVDVPGQGGIENYVFNLAKALTEKGHECLVLCRGEQPAHQNIDGININKLFVRENQFAILVHNIKAAWKVWGEYKDFDVINFQSIFLPFLYEWVPKIRGVKVIHTIHSFAHDNPKYNHFSRLIINIIYRLSSFVSSPLTTVSEQNRILIRKRLKKNSTVIHCGVNPPIHEEATYHLDKFAVQKGKYYLTIGRIDPVKNLDVLIKAFMKHPLKDDVKLVIAGNASNKYGECLRKLSNEDERVIFVGPVYGSEKSSLLNHCMAYCLVSSSEGFPIALLEAMSYGCPCICSDIPANKEALTERLGLWSKVQDEDSLFLCMKQLENSIETYMDLGEQAKRFILSNLTWNIIADKYVDFFKSLKRNHSI